MNHMRENFPFIDGINFLEINILDVINLFPNLRNLLIYRIIQKENNNAMNNQGSMIH
jgi:hypothetical protein